MKVLSAEQKEKFVVKRTRTGLGLFAREAIRKGAKIIEYTGELISTEEADRRGGRYLFDVNTKWVIDGTTRTNLARYVNHSCKPNAEARTVGKKVFIYARRKIEPGEQVAYDYGKEYCKVYINPCKCDACVKDETRKKSKEKKS